MGLCKDNNEFHKRLLYLTTFHASYANDQWIRIDQLPFNCNNNSININTSNSCKHSLINRVEKKGHKFSFCKDKNNILGKQAPDKILYEDLIEANIDRTGRIGWYRDPNTKTLMFFPGIFEPVESFFLPFLLFFSLVFLLICL